MRRRLSVPPSVPPTGRGSGRLGQVVPRLLYSGKAVSKGRMGRNGIYRDAEWSPTNQKVAGSSPAERATGNGRFAGQTPTGHPIFVACLVPRLVPQRDLENPEIARARIGRGTRKTSICGRSEHLLVVFHGGPPRSASWLLKDTTAAALGLCALLSQSAFAFSAVRWLGAAYLVYLGAKTLLCGSAPCPLVLMRIATYMNANMAWSAGSRSKAARMS
jgi:hypothetical protein